MEKDASVAKLYIQQSDRTTAIAAAIRVKFTSHLLCEA